MVLNVFCMETTKMQPRKISAAKNIFRGEITIKSSCLTPNERNYLIVAATAFLADSNKLLNIEELEKITEYLMGPKGRNKIRPGVSKFYSIIQSMVAAGEKLNFEDIPVVPISNIDRQINKLLEQNHTKQINDLKEELDVSRRQYRDLVESLVVQQREEAKEYFENLKPYKKKHERRFDFEVRNKPYTNEEVVERLRELYGDEYDYSQVDYKTKKTLITLRCKKHGVVFSRTFQNLLKGWGCPACNKEQGKTWANVVTKTYDPSRRSERWTTERFIAESKAYHGEGFFDYSQCHYVNNDTPVTLIRIVDGAVVNIRPDDHLRHNADYGVQRYYQGTTDKEKIYFLVRQLEENIETPIYVPIQKIEYSYRRLKCVCPMHGEFDTSLAKIRNGNCCPECDGSGESVGERNIRLYLQSKNIKFEQEFRIEDKKYFDTYARVDFYLPDLNTMIEFQGEQHYGIANNAITHGSRKWQSQKKRDNHLRRYAADHNVRLIEVPYTYRSNVDTFLAEQGIA